MLTSRFIPLAAVVLPLVLHVDTTTAQTSYPMLMSVKPVAASVGTTSEVAVQSRYDLSGAYRVLVSGQGVVAEPVPAVDKNGKPATNVTSLKLKVTVEPNALPGVRDFRIATPRGISTVGQLVITKGTLVSESGKNNTADTANEIQLPATVCGAIEANEDVDFFKFQASSGDRLCFHVRAMRLQNRIHDLQQHVDPIISIRHANGSTIAMNDNSFFADPVLEHQFEQAGEYLLEIRDVRYQGNRYWEYCIEIQNGPLIRNTFPPAINADAKPLPFKPVGWGLDGKANEEGLVVTRAANHGIGTAAFQSDELNSNPFPIFVSERPITLETSAANDSMTSAQPIKIASTISGRIESEADLDLYAIDLKKGEQISVEVFARRMQSELDSIIRILNADGRKLSESDDLTNYKHSFADSRIEAWAAPADGTYFIEIRDLHLRGGEEFVYAMNVESAEPDFDVYLDTDKTQLTPGTSGVIFVNAVRRNGFSGPLDLQITGLPAGVTAECGTIPDGRRDGCIVLTADANAQIACGNVTVSATSRSTEGSAPAMTHSAVVFQETYQPGGGRGHWPVDSHAVAIAEPSDLLAVRLSTHAVELKPGESVKIDIELERAEGFDKNVQLDMLFRHLNSVYADPLPAGVSIDAKNSKTLLTGKVSKGHITLTAAKEAVPMESQLACVMANVSLNFVMKATYSSKPLRISVRQSP